MKTTIKSVELGKEFRTLKAYELKAYNAIAGMIHTINILNDCLNVHIYNYLGEPTMEKRDKLEKDLHRLKYEYYSLTKPDYVELLPEGDFIEYFDEYMYMDIA